MSSYWLFISAILLCIFFFVKQKTAYEMRISDWSSDVCSSDLLAQGNAPVKGCAKRVQPVFSRDWLVPPLTVGLVRWLSSIYWHLRAVQEDNGGISLMRFVSTMALGLMLSIGGRAGVGVSPAIAAMPDKAPGQDSRKEFRG